MGGGNVRSSVSVHGRTPRVIIARVRLPSASPFTLFRAFFFTLLGATVSIMHVLRKQKQTYWLASIQANWLAAPVRLPSCCTRESRCLLLSFV